MISSLVLILSVYIRCIIPTQNVTAITQDSLGCIWLGGEDGLQRFDGYQIEKYLTTKQVPYYGYINRIYPADSLDAFLLCTTDGLYSYNYITNDFESLVPDLKRQNVTSYYRLRNQNRIVTTLSGLYIYNKEWELLCHVHPKSERVNMVFEDANGNVFVGTDSSLELLGSPSTGYATRLLANGRTRFIYVDSNQRLFFNSDSKICCCSIPDLLRQNDHEIEVLDDNVDVVTAYVIDSQLWVATRGQGILRYNIQGQVLSRAERVVIQSDGKEIHNSVLSLFQDNDSLIWIGTLDGLFRVQPDIQGFNMMRQTPASALPSNTIISIYVDSISSEKEKLWIGTASGLCEMSEPFTENSVQNNLFPMKTWVDYSVPSDVVAQNRIQMVARADNERLLVANKSQIKYFSFSSHRFQSDTQIDSICHIYGMRYPRAHYVDKDNNIWIAFNEGGIGLYRCSDNSLHSLQWQDYKQDVHRTIWRDTAGALWVSADTEGLYRLELSDDCLSVTESMLIPRERFNNQCITSFLISHDGTIYIGTFNGLFVLDHTYQCHMLDLPQSENQTYISTLLQSSDTDIWASSIRNIYRITPTAVRYYVLSHENDISKLWYIIGSAVSRSGRIYWGGTEGLICCNPEKIVTLHHVRTPIISRFMVNNEQVSFWGKDINYIESPIDLDYTQRQVTFEFACPEYLQPEGIYYEYQLDPIDKVPVVTNSGRRYASYNNLAYGNYTFRLRCTNAQGEWQNDYRSISFRINRPWFLQWWMIIIWIILGLSVGVVILRMAIVIRRLYRKQHELQKRITNLSVTPEDVTMVSDDDAFLQYAKQLVEKNIENEKFTVEEMASTLCMSPSGLYRRMLQLTELTPIEYIRSVRMKRAAQLLASHNYRVFEVATMVGFRDHRYFSNCFKKAYGVNPKTYSMVSKNNIEKTHQENEKD